MVAARRHPVRGLWCACMQCKSPPALTVPVCVAMAAASSGLFLGPRIFSDQLVAIRRSIALELITGEPNLPIYVIPELLEKWKVAPGM